jgi:hypothetical protein
LLYSALHGTAMRYAAERRSLDESIEELREIADGRNDILAGLIFAQRTVTKGGNAPARKERESRGLPGVRSLLHVDLNQIVGSFAACGITGLLMG